jgi:3-deoxy-D-manno-octulosonate 8-phosphate phosphatase (KDO 8-P phosphatase)
MKKAISSTAFTKSGGQFITSFSSLKKKMSLIRAYIFDWDGVFNDARKTGESQSYFTEVDSMGTNLLRFSHWLKNKHTLPFTAVISGEQNDAARFFLTREHFNAGYFQAKNKLIAFHHFCEQHNIKPQEIAFVFDDVLDMSVAAEAGLRICVHRKSNPLMNDFLFRNKLVDYFTANSGANHAVREAMELLITLHGNAEQVFSSRMKYDNHYTSYIAARNIPETVFYSAKEDFIRRMK